MRPIAHLLASASAASTGTAASTMTRARRCIAAALFVALAASTAGCTASAKKHEATESSGAALTPSSTSSTRIAAPKAATTPVLPPTPGDIHHTVAVHSASVNPAVGLKAVGKFGGRVTVHVTSIEAANAQAQGPGEVSGPAVVLTLRIDNASSQAIDLGNVVAALEGSTHAQATQMSAPPARGFSGSLAAGKHADAVYVFTLPTAQRKPVTLKVSYTTEAPVVVFVGDAP